MTGTGKHRKVLFIGAHGRVGLLALPKLVEEGHEVTGMIRRPEYAADLTALGVIPLVQDVTELDAAAWERLLALFDVVVWAAGAGGGAAPEVTRTGTRPWHQSMPPCGWEDGHRVTSWFRFWDR